MRPLARREPGRFSSQGSTACGRTPEIPRDTAGSSGVWAGWLPLQSSGLTPPFLEGGCLGLGLLESSTWGERSQLGSVSDIRETTGEKTGVRQGGPQLPAQLIARAYRVSSKGSLKLHLATQPFWRERVHLPNLQVPCYWCQQVPLQQRGIPGVGGRVLRACFLKHGETEGS